MLPRENSPPLIGPNNFSTVATGNTTHSQPDTRSSPASTVTGCCHWQHYAQSNQHTVFTGGATVADCCHWQHQAAPTARRSSPAPTVCPLLPLATLCTVQPTHGLHRGGDGGRLLPLATPSSADCQAVFTGADGLPTVATGNTTHSPTNTRSSPGGDGDRLLPLATPHSGAGHISKAPLNQ